MVPMQPYLPSRRGIAILALLLALAPTSACRPAPGPADPPASPDPVGEVEPTPEFPVSEEPSPEPPPEPPPPPPSVGVERAREVLFRGGAPPEHDCPGGEDPIDCLLVARYGDDPEALETARALYAEYGDVAGLEEEYEMDGGFRGMIQIVPERPVGRHRHHLTWVFDAQRDIAAVLEGLAQHTDEPLAFRHTALVWLFFRSVGRTTPSMVAWDWEVAYNVSGSLNKSATRVREGIVHEAFHLNDRARGGWSRQEIGYAVDRIVALCGTDVDCLKPYAPGRTKVRGGTYYAFQPDNGDIAREYAAELATRYFVEQRAILHGETPSTPSFKCGPWQNGVAWEALADEFFGGVDLTADCPPAP